MLLLFLAAACGKEKAPGKAAGSAPPPPPPPLGKFVGSETCRECHEERHATWLGTAHAYSLRLPTEETVKGRFDGMPVESKYFSATPYRRADGWFIRVTGKDGRPSGDYKVVHVIGRSFEQAYLFQGPSGEWRVLPICWSLEHERWDLTHEVLADITGSPGFPADYDTRNHIFNHGCAQCHAVDYDVGYDVERDAYDSKFVEGAVACESCHGPGAAHTAWHRASKGTGPEYADPARLLHPKRDLDAPGVAATCGRCHYLHEWRYAIDDDPRVGYREIAVTLNHDGPGFFLHGMLSGLNYEGSTQAQSDCYLKGGMSCLSCHRMHGGKRWAMKYEENDDAQCTQCHKEMEATHTHHKEARCVDCHMPRFLSGVLHTLRDHRIMGPEPELTERFGEKEAPNACGVCHRDQDAAWARKWKEEWWGPAPRRLVEDVQAVADLRREPAKVVTAALIALAERTESRLFFRLTAVRNLIGRQEEGEARAAMARLLGDPHPEVRQMAARGVASRPDPEAAGPLLPLLRDPVRTVRVEAAFALAKCGWRGATPEYRSVFEEARLMLHRQKPFPETLERVVAIADAAGSFEEFDHWLSVMIRMQAWPADVAQLVHRRARAFTDRGRHAEALEEYQKAESLYAGQVPEMLFIDAADSLAAVGRRKEAEDNWRHLDASSAPDSVLRLLARVRLGLEPPEALQAAITRLQAVPSAGEVLRRLRWEPPRR